MSTLLQVKGNGPYEVLESDAPIDGYATMTREEYAALAAAYVPPPDSQDDQWADFLSGSITVGDISLKASIEARDAFTGQVILIREALDAGLLTASSPISIWDAADVERSMTVTQCRALLLSYGIQWQAAFAQLAP